MYHEVLIVLYLWKLTVQLLRGDAKQRGGIGGAVTRTSLANRAHPTGGLTQDRHLTNYKILARARSRHIRRPAATYVRDYQINTTSGYAHILRDAEHFGE